MRRLIPWPWATCIALLGIAVLLAVTGGSDVHHLRKFIGAALTPVALVWLLLAGLAVLLWRRHQHRPAAVAGACWLVLSLAGNPHLAAYQLALLEGPTTPPQEGEIATLDALLVLGGGAAITSRGRVTLGDAAERVTLPVRLYHQGATGTLVTSGPALASALPPGPPSQRWPPPSYPQAVEGIWTSLGVTPEHVIRVEGPRTTREEIEAHRRLVAERGWQRVGLVTSAWHMRRALRHCRRVGLDVIALPCDARGDPPRWRWRQLVPSAGALENTSVAWNEAMALLAGR